MPADATVLEVTGGALYRRLRRIRSVGVARRAPQAAAAAHEQRSEDAEPSEGRAASGLEPSVASIQRTEPVGVARNQPGSLVCRCGEKATLSYGLMTRAENSGGTSTPYNTADC